MSGKVHEDEGGLLIGDVQRGPVGGRFPTPDIVLDLPVVEGIDEPINQVGLVLSVLVRVGKVVQYPHASMQLLYRLIRQLNHTVELRPQQLGVARRNEPALVLIQNILERLRSGDADIHDGLQRQTSHVSVRQVFRFLIRPSVIGGNHLELEAPGQEVFPQKIGEV